MNYLSCMKSPVRTVMYFANKDDRKAFFTGVVAGRMCMVRAAIEGHLCTQPILVGAKEGLLTYLQGFCQEEGIDMDGLEVVCVCRFYHHSKPAISFYVVTEDEAKSMRELKPGDTWVI